jgi:hypothetical protein
MKQYFRGKPSPVRLTKFVRRNVPALAYGFEICQGKTRPTGIADQHKRLGLGGSVVM